MCLITCLFLNNNLIPLWHIEGKLCCNNRRYIYPSICIFWEPRGSNERAHLLLSARLKSIFHSEWCGLQGLFLVFIGIYLLFLFLFILFSLLLAFFAFLHDSNALTSRVASLLACCVSFDACPNTMNYCRHRKRRRVT
jgi:hypothetical protein